MARRRARNPEEATAPRWRTEDGRSHRFSHVSPRAGEGEGDGGAGAGRTRRTPAHSAVALAALAGLVAAAFVTLAFWNNPLGLGLVGRPGKSVSVQGRTAAPVNVVVPNPAAPVPGSVVYVKDGNLWVQTGTQAHELTTAGTDSMAAWSPDGRWIYFIETRVTTGEWPPISPILYTLTYPVLMKVQPDGSGKQDVLSSLIEQGKYKYFYWLREPSISPDGKTAAVIADGPDPMAQDTLLQFVDLTTGKLLPAPSLPETAPLGHTSPVWSPDGTRVAFTMEGKSASGQAEPSIWIYDVARRSAKQLSTSGYRFPSWSPDGRYIAATRDRNQKLDIVVLDASTGAQVAQLTSDGQSQMPVWSPKGDSLIYLRMIGSVTDLRLIALGRSGGAIQAASDTSVTENSGIDPSSRPAWYIPAS